MRLFQANGVRLTSEGSSACAATAARKDTMGQRAFSDRPLYEVMMSPHQRVGFRLLVGVWVLSLGVFYLWWFRSEHVAGWFKFVINTCLLTWTLAMPAYFFFFVARMRRINPRLVLPQDWRVAMITTRAPSEPFAVV